MKTKELQSELTAITLIHNYFSDRDVVFMDAERDIHHISEISIENGQITLYETERTSSLDPER